MYLKYSCKYSNVFKYKVSKYCPALDTIQFVQYSERWAVTRYVTSVAFVTINGNALE